MSSSTPTPPPKQSPIADLRVNYSSQPLDDATLTPTPFGLFTVWLDEARQANVHEPNAMTLATADSQGRPSARVVLLKGVDERGFVWYTNYESRKSEQLAQNPYAALSFWWPELERSVRIEGIVARVPVEESDAYFQSRPADSRLGAWASDQSRPLAERESLEEKWARLRKEHLSADGNHVIKTITRPPHWGGFRLVPSRVEFWKGRHARLHDRVVYNRELPERSVEEMVVTPVEEEWKCGRVQP